jgi:solute carrier family 45, member 1/2/4
LSVLYSRQRTPHRAWEVFAFEALPLDLCGLCASNALPPPVLTKTKSRLRCHEPREASQSMPASVSRVSSASSVLEPPPAHSDEPPEWITNSRDENLSVSSTLHDGHHANFHATDRNGERAPLLGDTHAHAAQQGDDVVDDFSSTKSIWFLILLTISISGLQIAWSVELSNGSPYLLSLGVSKSLMALVWIAGPLSGTLVQPYVGMLSDNCTISWGKRKPFIVGGALATSVSLMMLAWTKEVVGGISDAAGADTESHGVKVATIVVAVAWVYILDFAINTGMWSPSSWLRCTFGAHTSYTVQAAIRAFIVDCAPPQQQGMPKYIP